MKVFKFDRRTRRPGAQLLEMPVPVRIENPNEVRVPLPDDADGAEWTLATHAYNGSGQRLLFRSAVIFCTSQAGGVWRWVLLLAAEEKFDKDHRYMAVHWEGYTLGTVLSMSDKRALELVPDAVLVLDMGESDV